MQRNAEQCREMQRNAVKFREMRKNYKDDVDEDHNVDCGRKVVRTVVASWRQSVSLLTRIHKLEFSE